MNDIRDNTHGWIREVEKFLRVWDPIGIIADLEADGFPPDEYDSYAPYIVGLLHRGATPEELAAHLRYCRTGAMGLRANDPADFDFAQQIHEWWRQELKNARSPAD